MQEDSPHEIDVPNQVPVLHSEGESALANLVMELNLLDDIHHVFEEVAVLPVELLALLCVVHFFETLLEQVSSRSAGFRQLKVASLELRVPDNLNIAGPVFEKFQYALRDTIQLGKDVIIGLVVVFGVLKEEEVE